MNRRPKIVLHQSQQVTQASGQEASCDMLPLELLHSAAIPAAEGCDVTVIDASLCSVEEGHLVIWRDAQVVRTTARPATA